MGTRTRQARGPQETPHGGADRVWRWGERRTRRGPSSRPRWSVTCWQGLSRPLRPTRTVWLMHNQSGERACSDRYPHDHFMETNLTRIGYRHLAEDGSLPGAHRRPRTQLVGLGELPLHQHRTMQQRYSRFDLCAFPVVPSIRITRASSIVCQRPRSAISAWIRRWQVAHRSAASDTRLTRRPSSDSGTT